MISLTKINREKIMLNADLIESVSSAPDTVVLLTSGKSIMVLESPQEIREKIIEFRRQIFLNPLGADENSEK